MNENDKYLRNFSDSSDSNSTDSSSTDSNSTDSNSTDFNSTDSDSSAPYSISPPYTLGEDDEADIYSGECTFSDEWSTLTRVIW